MDNRTKISFLCVNDFHAEIFQTENTPGCARFVTAVNTFVQQNPGTVILFGGDNYKGDPVSETCGGKPVTKMMAKLGTVASAIGNHEFDFGIQALELWQQEGAYQFVAANLTDTQTGQIPPFVKPYVVFQQNGIKVVVLGLCMKEPLATVDRPPEMTRYQIADVVPAAKYWVEHLNKTETPNAIVALTHLPMILNRQTGAPIGEETLALCRALPELAGVFTAHLHQFIAMDIHGVPVVQAGSSGRGYGVLELSFSRNGELLESKPGTIDLRGTFGEFAPDSTMEKVVEECKRTAMGKLGKIAARQDADLWHRDPVTNEVSPGGTPFSALAVEVMRRRTGCPIALFYAGRMGKGLEKGPITLYQLHQLFLFNNSLVTMKLSGAAIQANIETGLRTLAGECASPIAIGGLEVVADMAAPYKSRVVSIALPDGEALEPAALYDVVLDDYLAENPLGFNYASGTDVVYTGISLRESMIEEICRTGAVQSKFRPSVVLKG